MEITIENFKSIEKLKLNLARINILIGPPGSGKSNILEAIYLYGFPFKIIETYKYDEFENYPSNLFKLIRFEDFVELFYNVENPIIKVGDIIFKLEDGSLKFKINNRILDLYPLYESDEFKEEIEVIDLGKKFIPVRLYKFDKIPSNVYSSYPKSYLAEDLSNLRKIFPILRNDKYYKKLKEDYKISIDFETLRLYDIDNDKFLSFTCLSDGLTKFLILLLAVKSNIRFKNIYNKDVLILLEEPETHMFSYLISELVRLIIEKSNKLIFVITTHNPYFVRDLILEANRKERLKEVKIFKVVRKSGKTVIDRELSGEEVYMLLSEGYDMIEDFENI